MLRNSIPLFCENVKNFCQSESAVWGPLTKHSGPKSEFCQPIFCKFVGQKALKNLTNAQKWRIILTPNLMRSGELTRTSTK